MRFIPKLLRPRFFGTYVVMAMVAAVMVLLIVPGEGWWCLDNGGNAVVYDFRHGWPWQFQRRWTPLLGKTLSSIESEARQFRGTFKRPSEWVNYNDEFPWLCADAWRFCGEFQTVDFWPLIGDVFVGLVFPLLAGIVYERRRRSGLKIFQFNLLEMFLLVSAICVALAYLAYQKRLFEQELRQVHEQEIITCDYDYIGPVWLSKLIGCANLPWQWRVATITYLKPANYSKAGMQRISSSFSNLRCIYDVEICRVRTDGFSELKSLPKLEEVWLNTDCGNDVPNGPTTYNRAPGTVETTDVLELVRDIPSLTSINLSNGLGNCIAVPTISPLPNIRRLSLSGFNRDQTLRFLDGRTFPSLAELSVDEVTADDIDLMPTLRQVRDLTINGNPRPKDLWALAKLKQLEVLCFCSNNIEPFTRAEIEPLSKMDHLRVLIFFPSPRLSREAVRFLHRGLPTTRIICEIDPNLRDLDVDF